MLVISIVKWFPFILIGIVGWFFYLAKLGLNHHKLAKRCYAICCWFGLYYCRNFDLWNGKKIRLSFIKKLKIYLEKFRFYLDRMVVVVLKVAMLIDLLWAFLFVGFFGTVKNLTKTKEKHSWELRSVFKSKIQVSIEPNRYSCDKTKTNINCVGVFMVICVLNLRVVVQDRPTDWLWDLEKAFQMIDHYSNFEWNHWFHFERLQNHVALP